MARSVLFGAPFARSERWRKMKITKIETVQLEDYPNITFVGVHTDEGLIGWGDTY